MRNERGTADAGEKTPAKRQALSIAEMRKPSNEIAR
jgi:hypothetical protein